VPFHGNPHASQTNQLRAIHPESRNCRPAIWRQAIDYCCVFVPGKMVSPIVSLRMEQRDVSLSIRIGGLHAIRFEAIARRTRETEILVIGRTSRGSWNNVLEFKYGNRQFLGSSTVGAAIRKTSANPSLNSSRNVDGHT
jgi:hypothetical protein